MKRLQLTILEDTYNTIKLSAKHEKRSVTNYLDILLTSLFHDDVIIKSEFTNNNSSIETQIKLDSELLESTKITESNIELQEIRQHGRVLTDEERAYLFENPFSDLSDFEKSKANNNEGRLF